MAVNYNKLTDTLEVTWIDTFPSSEKLIPNHNLYHLKDVELTGSHVINARSDGVRVWEYGFIINNVSQYCEYPERFNNKIRGKDYEFAIDVKYRFENIQGLTYRVEDKVTFIFQHQHICPPIHVTVPFDIDNDIQDLREYKDNLNFTKHIQLNDTESDYDKYKQKLLELKDKYNLLDMIETSCCDSDYEFILYYPRSMNCEQMLNIWDKIEEEMNVFRKENNMEYMLYCSLILLNHR